MSFNCFSISPLLTQSFGSVPVSEFGVWDLIDIIQTYTIIRLLKNKNKLKNQRRKMTFFFLLPVSWFFHALDFELPLYLLLRYKESVGILHIGSWSWKLIWTCSRQWLDSTPPCYNSNIPIMDLPRPENPGTAIRYEDTMLCSENRIMRCSTFSRNRHAAFIELSYMLIIQCKEASPLPEPPQVGVTDNTALSWSP